MTEDEDLEIERTLRRYRPAGPDPALRTRVLAAQPRPRRLTTWLSMAALLTAAVWLHTQASRTHENIGVALAAGRASAVEAEINMVTYALGGGEIAREMAQQIVVERARANAAQRAQRPAMKEAPWTQ